jgi:hypothetical protein
MNQSLVFAPTDAWRAKIRRRLELLEGRRLATPESILDAFYRNRDVFRPEAHQRIEAALRLHEEPPAGQCLTCGAGIPDRSRYFCCTLCEQNSRLVIRSPHPPPVPRKSARTRGRYSA